MYVLLSENAHATYATWTVIASFLNLYIALFYVGEVDGELCAYISLGSVLGLAVLWFIVETVFLDDFFRFVVTPYAGKSEAVISLVSRFHYPQEQIRYLLYGHV